MTPYLVEPILKHLKLRKSKVKSVFTVQAKFELLSPLYQFISGPATRVSKYNKFLVLNLGITPELAETALYPASTRSNK